MEIRDPIHGPIHILDEEIPILENPFFQRLRNIKQLGFSEYIFPGATHTRFLHSIGVMKVATQAFDKLFGQQDSSNRDVLRLKETFKLACLLHDIGHAPLSHSTEMVMPNLSELKLPARFLGKEDIKKDRRGQHEDYTIKAIVDGPLSDSFQKVGKNFGVGRDPVAELIVGHTSDPAYFTIKGISYFPLLHQLVTSELDCDRMDYLLRDSYFCGVSYGQFDLNWILDNLRICTVEGKAYLGISERAVSTFDDFLLGRYHMFLMVYFHYRAVCLEQLLLRFFQTSGEEYRIPSNMEEYQQHDDYFLMDVLKRSQNRYAQQIVKNSIPAKIYESFGQEDLGTVDELEQYLRSLSVEFIRSSSKSRLSKYCHPNEPGGAPKVMVMREFPRQGNPYMLLEEATGLFQKYSEAHTVTRLHCYLEELSSVEKKHIEKITGRKL